MSLPSAGPGMFLTSTASAKINAGGTLHQQGEVSHPAYTEAGQEVAWWPNDSIAIAAPECLHTPHFDGEIHRKSAAPQQHESLISASLQEGCYAPLWE